MNVFLAGEASWELGTNLRRLLIPRIVCFINSILFTVDVRVSNASEQVHMCVCDFPLARSKEASLIARQGNNNFWLFMYMYDMRNDNIARMSSSCCSFDNEDTAVHTVSEYMLCGTVVVLRSSIE